MAQGSGLQSRTTVSSNLTAIFMEAKDIQMKWLDNPTPTAKFNIGGSHTFFLSRDEVYKLRNALNDLSADITPYERRILCPSEGKTTKPKAKAAKPKKPKKKSPKHWPNEEL